MDRPAAPGAGRRRLLVFSLACLVLSWGPWTVVALLGTSTREGAGYVWFAIGAFGPTLAALVALFAGRPARMRLRSPWVWFPAAFVAGALPAIIGVLIAGGVLFGARSAYTITVNGGWIGFIAIFLIAGPLSEEFGWRGYLQPVLRERFGVAATAGIVGAAWALWHVPLFLLPGTWQAGLGLFTDAGVLFLLEMPLWSFVYLFVAERLGGGVMAAILIHFASNASGALLPPASTADSLVRFLAVAGLALVSWLGWGAVRRVPRSTGIRAVAEPAERPASG
ncbi:CPBP family intramembrane glutamic endopeptidase [Agromyces seonyuensis]|uniref:CPBP family intramembrane metalloprotease n=1 Tax=Agromyces seonyuensis TaxID=2662446 RepID=A0A6I4NZK9_9MICO|nr:CPBP family intramembrane glutamic endopeptidase [Agromyces seonyuensis]MWB99718.1 CPBP family intramembrane metalloprotease [Agromyces seonyuensis]